jgi:hypothetical protein
MKNEIFSGSFKAHSWLLVDGWWQDAVTIKNVGDDWMGDWREWFAETELVSGSVYWSFCAMHVYCVHYCALQITKLWIAICSMESKLFSGERDFQDHCLPSHNQTTTFNLTWYDLIICACNSNFKESVSAYLSSGLDGCESDHYITTSKFPILTSSWWLDLSNNGRKYIQ